MQTKRIQCPNCKVILDVKNSKNEEVKQITCPQCKAVLQVKFPPQQEPLEAITILGGAMAGATQLESSPKIGGNARLEFEGVPFFLEEGLNIVGRKGNTSKATIQIATEDRYMSRQHCSITVTTLPDGTQKAVLSNYQNKNLTTIDGQDIETGDAIRLFNGNHITMGRTTVVFKL